MRRVILFLTILVILSTCGAAAKLYNTEMPGKNPSIYGSIIAFETHEDYAGKDLNGDKDMGDTVIQYYDTEQKTTISTQTTGKNPAVFANYIVFETSEAEEHKDLNDDGDETDTIFQYYNLHDQKTTNTKIEANDIYLYQYLVVFSTPEQSLKVDYNNDGDLDDPIVFYYDLLKKELSNTKQVGKNPSTNGRRILIITNEEEVNIDLNIDGDQKDQVFQIYSMEAKTIFPIQYIGTGMTANMNKQGKAVYIQDNKLQIHDVEANFHRDIQFKADYCSINEDIIICNENNQLKTFNLQTDSATLVDIRGENPDRFDNIIAFQTREEFAGDLNNDGDQKDTIIRYAISEDNDGDGLIELIDNCPNSANPVQADIDNDGIGDECDATDDRPKEVKQQEQEIQQTEQTVQTTDTTAKSDEKPTENKSSWEIWFGIIIIILIVIIASVLLVPGYYRRKRKGFGF